LAATRRHDTLIYRAHRDTTMQLVLKYERHAAECREMAAETQNPRYKKQLEDMAEVWERLAAERRQGIITAAENSLGDEWQATDQ
jgi:hypothetical protein